MAMRYIRLKKLNPGSELRGIVLRERSKKFSKKSKDTWVSKKQSILITGLAASGKSRELEKLHDARADLYPKAKGFIKLSATDSLADWILKNVTPEKMAEYIESHQEDEVTHAYLAKNEKRQAIQLQALEHAAAGAVLFVDDLDRCTGKKKEVIKPMIKAARLVIATAESETSIDKTLGHMLKSKRYNEITLNSSQSYDVTNAAIVSLIIMMLATGQYEMAMLIMAMRYAMKGKGA